MPFMQLPGDELMVSVERDLRIADVVGDHEVLLGIAQLLSEILCEMKHLGVTERTGAVSSIALEDLAKGDPKVTTKTYIGSPLTNTDVDQTLDVHAYAHREAARRAMQAWADTVDGLQNGGTA